MGTVYRVEFFPRWRVRFVMYDQTGHSADLCEGVWWETQGQAEEHAKAILDNHFRFEGRWPQLYDIQHQERPEDVPRT